MAIRMAFSMARMRRANCFGERTAQEKGFCQCGDLPILGNGGVVKAWSVKCQPSDPSALTTLSAIASQSDRGIER